MIPQAARPHFHKRWLLLFTLGSAALPASAAPRAEPPPLFGGAAAALPSAGEPDAGLPTGAAFTPGVRPPPGVAACSPRRPLCVHPQSGVSAADTLAALDAADDAYGKLIEALDLPAPLADGALGGSSALDVYLDADAGEPVLVEYDDPELSGFDRASAFCRLLAQSGPLLERAATLCVAEAIALRLDPAETPHLRRAFATALWWIVGSPTVLDLEALQLFQLQPERAVARGARDRASEGAALLFEYLESTRGVAQPGALSAALLSASAQRTRFDRPQWNNEPDVMDVVRHTLEQSRARAMALYRDFCVSRAFIGARDDGRHLPLLAWGGEFAAPRFDWVIPFSSLPRRVLLTRPVEPGGTVLLWLELDQLPAGASLGFRAEWEAPVSFAWTLVRVGADGAELSRVDLPFQERASSAEGRVAELAGARAIVGVGTFLDEVTLAHPFDPDVEPFEPHGATVYFARL